MLQQISGASEVKIEQTTGLPMLTVHIDREKASRYGLNMGDVQDTISTALGGREAGTVFEGDKRFDIQVRLPDAVRNDMAALGRLPIALPRAADGRLGFVPLSSVATLDIAPGPNQVSREDGKRRIVVSANVRGRDIGSFVGDAQQRLESVQLPAGYWTRWGGTFENLESARQRLSIVVPAALQMVFVLLFAMFGNVRDGLIVFTGIPFALTGGIVALWLRDIPLSISAAVGFIALSGVAVLNGLVMIAYIRSLREAGRRLYDAVTEGALTRLRPVLMTALVASLGFVPMAIATGTGTEVQRPLATVVIGGILSSTILTLLVLPLLYRLVHRRDLSEAEEGAPPDSTAEHHA
jgi:cobalt-zinc-cadmium resistance protein CzcA